MTLEHVNIEKPIIKQFDYFEHKEITNKYIKVSNTQFIYNNKKFHGLVITDKDNFYTQKDRLSSLYKIQEEYQGDLEKICETDTEVEKNIFIRQLLFKYDDKKNKKQYNVYDYFLYHISEGSTSLIVNHKREDRYILNKLEIISLAQKEINMLIDPNFELIDKENYLSKNRVDKKIYTLSLRWLDYILYINIEYDILQEINSNDLIISLDNYKSGMEDTLKKELITKFNLPTSQENDYILDKLSEYPVYYGKNSLYKLHIVSNNVITIYNVLVKTKDEKFIKIPSKKKFNKFIILYISLVIVALILIFFMLK